MSESIQNTIQTLADELKQFNRNDVLVNFSNEPSLSLEKMASNIELPNESELRNTLRKARTLFRESGTSVFCLSKGILKWDWNGTDCHTPILLIPCDFKENKIKKNFMLSWENKEAFLNPFLKHFFKREFNFDWPPIELENPDWDKLQSFLDVKGFVSSVQDEVHFGNFHHHRFSILRELESLSGIKTFNKTLSGLFNEHRNSKTSNLELTPQNLFPADKDQHLVFSAVQKDDYVVHGPPGTGKSQVLSNLLGKNLAGGLSTLVVSEKRVALEVLEQKLETVGLNRFLFLQGESTNAQHLLDQLKDTWQFLEDFSTPEKEIIPVAQLKLDALQMKLDILSEESRVGGISYLEFLSLKNNRNLRDIDYKSDSPSISEFLDQKNNLVKLFDQNLNRICAVLPKAILDNDSISHLDKKIESIEKDWRALNKIIPIANKQDLKSALQKAVFAQIMQNESQKAYFKVLEPNSTSKNKFNRLVKKYFVLKKELSNLEEKQSEWKSRPSEIETKQLLNACKATGFFQKRKFKKRMSQLVASDYIPYDDALTNNLIYLQKQVGFREIEKKLTEIGIQTETDIHWVKGLLEQATDKNWLDWQANSADENEKLADANGLLSTFNQNVRAYLSIEDETIFEETFSLFHTHFDKVLEQRKLVSSFSNNLYTTFCSCTDLKKLERVVLKSNWIRFVEQFPSFGEFELNQIGSDLDEIIRLEVEESNYFSQNIQAQQKAKFDELNTFLQVPARKLNETEKARKVRLRRGRSLLIKEFGKSRSHPTIRELLESDAAEWIYSLLPIWMVNSSQVGDFFPLDIDLFDMVLFDEATQIPLSNALGSMYRGKRAVVLGDEHQMSPTSYFKAGDSEPIDLLHQAAFNWPKVMLKHHYRSQDPELISFSNRHFYKGELIAYPKANRLEKPVEIRYIENGVYNEQENEIEAVALAKTLSNLLKDKSISIGVVAFSEKQLKCIYRQLNPSDQLSLDERIENNSAFFRALENVQGDECDRLLISLGYGPNAEGKLNLNFGPLNRKSGPRRLNVLFSRAKQKIDFFTSIKSTDLSISDNDALNLLRKFLNYHDNVKNSEEYTFPHGLQINRLTPKGDLTEISFVNLFDTISDAQELLTFYNVLSNRGWKITF